MTDPAARTPTALDFGILVDHERCPHCGVEGQVLVHVFHWDGQRKLNWICQSCRNVWAETERRSDDRSNS
jgi:hypothetical protein